MNNIKNIKFSCQKIIINSTILEENWKILSLILFKDNKFKKFNEIYKFSNSSKENLIFIYKSLIDIIWEGNILIFPKIIKSLNIIKNTNKRLKFNLKNKLKK